MKFSSVRTFIASGNVIFQAPKQDLRKLEQKIEKELVKDFDYEATVVVKSKPEMDAILKGMSKDWIKPAATTRYYVIFLRDAIDSKRLLDDIPARPGVETLTYCPGALLWAAKKSDARQEHGIEEDPREGDLPGDHRAQPQHDEEARRADGITMTMYRSSTSRSSSHCWAARRRPRRRRNPRRRRTRRLMRPLHTLAHRRARSDSQRGQSCRRSPQQYGATASRSRARRWGCARPAMQRAR